MCINFYTWEHYEDIELYATGLTRICPALFAVKLEMLEVPGILYYYMMKNEIITQRLGNHSTYFKNWLWTILYTFIEIIHKKTTVRQFIFSMRKFSNLMKQSFYWISCNLGEAESISVKHYYIIKTRSRNADDRFTFYTITSFKINHAYLLKHCFLHCTSLHVQESTGNMHLIHCGYLYLSSYIVLILNGNRLEMKNIFHYLAVI